MFIFNKISSGGPGLFFVVALWMLICYALLNNLHISWLRPYCLFFEQLASLIYKKYKVILKGQFPNSSTGPCLFSVIYPQGFTPDRKSSRPDFRALLSGSVQKAGFLLGIFVVFSFSNLDAATIISTGTGGAWSNPATWVGRTVPVAGDDVTIVSGAMVIIDSDITVGTLTVSGTLQFNELTPQVLTANNIITVNAKGILRSAPSGTVKTHQLIAQSSIINNGTIDFSSNLNETGVEIIFTGSGNAIFSCSDAVLTNLRKTNGLILNKGTSAASVLSFMPGNTFQVLSNGDSGASGFLSIVNGTFNIIGSRNFSNPVFNTDGNYTIPATGGFWLGNQNATVIAMNGTVTVLGELKIANGTYSVGISGSNSLEVMHDGKFKMSGGVLNISGKLKIDGGAGSVSGGKINLEPRRNLANVEPTIDISADARFEMYGDPLITLAFPNSNHIPVNDIQILDGSGFKSIKGGTIQLGTEATPAGSTFLINANTILNQLTAFSACSIHALNTSDADVTNTPVSSMPVIPFDLIAPKLTAPAKITIQCGETIPAAYATIQEFTNAGGSATDNCTLNPASFKLISQVQSKTNCPYTISRTYEISDVSGNVGKAEQQIVVEGEPEPANDQVLRLKSAMGIEAGLPAFTTPGAGTWLCPAGVTSITVECWGGGGKGGSTANNGTETGGGGGGAYSRSTLTVVPGITYDFYVGAGSTTTAAGRDSWFLNATTVMSKGGNSVANNTATGAAGGAAGSGFGTTKLSGGSGANGNNGNNGGGGGSSAGTSLDGTNATNATGATAPVGGGNGGSGRSGSNGNGNNGSIPGGGGGGVRSGSSGTQSGGSGANGKVSITWTCPTDAGILSGTQNVCVGANTTFSSTVLGGSWSSANTAIATVNASTGVITGVASGTTTLTYTVDAGGGCTVQTTSRTVTVIPLPTATISGTSTICSGGTSTITVDLTGSQPWNITYTDVTTSVTVNGITSSPYTFNVTLGSAKTYTITAVSDVNCTGTFSGSAIISIYPALNPGTINTGTRQYCVGGTAPIGGSSPTYAPPSGGSGNLTMIWQKDEGCTGSWVDIPGANTSSYTPVAPLTTTCYRRKVTDNTCGNVDYTGSMKFEIYPDLVSQDIVRSPVGTEVCEGTNISASFINGSGGAPGLYTDVYEYSIDFGSTWNSYVAGNSISTNSLSGTNVVSIRTRRENSGVAGCNIGSYVIESWTVYPTPTVNAIANQSFCNNETAPLIGLSGPVPLTTFSWVNSNTAIGLAASGTGDIPSFTATNTSNATATATISVTPHSTHGALTCDGETQTFTITVYSTPTVTATPTSQTICSGLAPNIVLSSVVPGTVFSWTVVESGVNGASAGSGSVINQTLTNTGGVNGTAKYTITPKANNCDGTPISVTITVQPPPTVVAPSNQIYCFGETTLAIPLSVTPASGVVFDIKGGTAVGLADMTGYTQPKIPSYPAKTGTATITITPIANGCSGTPVTFTVTVNPRPNIQLSASTRTICSGESTNISISSTTVGATFSWEIISMTGTISGTSSGTGNLLDQTLINNTATTGTVRYQITSSAGGCEGGTVNLNVTVHPEVTATIGGTTTACQDDSPAPSITFTASGGGGPYTFTYAINGSANQQVVANSGSTATVTAPTNVAGTFVYHLVSVAGSTGCAYPQTGTATVTVNPKPVLTSTLTPDGICSNTPFNYTHQSSVLNTDFHWVREVVSGIINPREEGDNIYPDETLVNTTTSPIEVIYTYTLKANGCTNVQYVKVMVTQSPVLTSTLSPDPICSGTTFSYIPSSNINPGTSFSWTRAADSYGNSSKSGIYNPTINPGGYPNEILYNNSTSPINVTYHFSLSSNGCTNPSDFPVNVAITPAPIV